jgi:hypothetical protein
MDAAASVGSAKLPSYLVGRPKGEPHTHGSVKDVAALSCANRGHRDIVDISQYSPCYVVIRDTQDGSFISSKQRPLHLVGFTACLIHNPPPLRAHEVAFNSLAADLWRSLAMYAAFKGFDSNFVRLVLFRHDTSEMMDITKYASIYVDSSRSALTQWLEVSRGDEQDSASAQFIQTGLAPNRQSFKLEVGTSADLALFTELLDASCQGWIAGRIFIVPGKLLSDDADEVEPVEGGEEVSFPVSVRLRGFKKNR